MGLGAHLLELRKRIVISALAIVVAMVCNNRFLRTKSVAMVVYVRIS